MQRLQTTLGLIMAMMLSGQADAQAPEPGPVLFKHAEPNSIQGMDYPLVASEQNCMAAMVDAARRAGIDVPVPRDAGGGFTH